MASSTTLGNTGVMGGAPLAMGKHARTMTRALVKSRRPMRLVCSMEAAMWVFSAEQMPLACSKKSSGRALPTLYREGGSRWWDQWMGASHAQQRRRRTCSPPGCTRRCHTGAPRRSAGRAGGARTPARMGDNNLVRAAYQMIQRQMLRGGDGRRPRLLHRVAMHDDGQGNLQAHGRRRRVGLHEPGALVHLPGSMEGGDQSRESRELGDRHRRVTGGGGTYHVA